MGYLVGFLREIMIDFSFDRWLIEKEVKRVDRVFYVIRVVKVRKFEFLWICREYGNIIYIEVIKYEVGSGKWEVMRLEKEIKVRLWRVLFEMLVSLSFLVGIVLSSE